MIAFVAHAMLLAISSSCGGRCAGNPEAACPLSGAAQESSADDASSEPSGVARVEWGPPLSISLEVGAQSLEETRALEELLQLLRTVEPCRSSLRLHFRRKESFREDSLQEAREDIDLDFEQPDSWGWWAREASLERILIHETLTTAEVRVLDTLKVGDWYRIAEQKLDARAAAALADGLPTFPGVLEHDSSAGTSFQDTCLPPSIGIGFMLWTWPEILAAAYRLRVLGRSDWYGVDCLLVIYDSSPRGGNGLDYEGPQLIWFDDQRSGLALGMRSYRPFPARMESFYESQAGTLLHMNGRPLGLVAEVDVLDAEELENGCWIATLARILSVSRTSEPPRWYEKVIEISPPPNSPPSGTDWFSSRLPPGTSVFSTSGAARVVLADGISLATESEARYAELLGIAYSELDLDLPSLELAVGHPFENGSCGPAALLMLAHLEGIRLSYGDLLARLGSGGPGEAVDSLGSIGRAAVALGFSVRAVEIGVSDLRGASGPFLAWVEGEPFAESHFGLAIPVQGGFAFYSPPQDRHAFSASEFEAIYRGIALIPEERARQLVHAPESEPDPDAVSGSVRRGLVVGCAVLLLAVVFWRRRLVDSPRPGSGP